jgi:hypothetical protein
VWRCDFKNVPTKAKGAKSFGAERENFEHFELLDRRKRLFHDLIKIEYYRKN